jgi:hypothetical protein
VRQRWRRVLSPCPPSDQAPIKPRLATTAGPRPTPPAVPGSGKSR